MSNMSANGSKEIRNLGSCPVCVGAGGWTSGLNLPIQGWYPLWLWDFGPLWGAPNTGGWIQ